MKVIPSEFGAWRQDPITKFVFAKIEELADESLQTLFATLRHPESPGTHAKACWNHGYIEGLTHVMQLVWDDFGMEEEDAES